MSNHLRVVVVISSGIGPQGKFQLFMFPIVISGIFHMRKEQKRKVTSYGVNLESVGHRECLPGNRFSMFCTCYLVALMTCFLIGLMSLSLVLRAASYFKLVPFHIVVQPIFITAWVGHLGLDSLSGDILRFFIPECTKKCTR